MMNLAAEKKWVLALYGVENKSTHVRWGQE